MCPENIFSNHYYNHGRDCFHHTKAPLGLFVVHFFLYLLSHWQANICFQLWGMKEVLSSEVLSKCDVVIPQTYEKTPSLPDDAQGKCQSLPFILVRMLIVCAENVYHIFLLLDRYL